METTSYKTLIIGIFYSIQSQDSLWDTSNAMQNGRVEHVPTIV